MTFLQDLPDSRLFWFCLGLLTMALMCMVGMGILQHFCARDEEEPDEIEEDKP